MTKTYMCTSESDLGNQTMNLEAEGYRRMDDKQPLKSGEYHVLVSRTEDDNDVLFVVRWSEKK